MQKILKGFHIYDPSMYAEQGNKVLSPFFRKMQKLRFKALCALPFAYTIGRNVSHIKNPDFLTPHLEFFSTPQLSFWNPFRDLLQGKEEAKWPGLYASAPALIKAGLHVSIL